MNKINGKKLKEMLTKDGTRLVDHDRKIGYADGYFHNCIRRNQINNIAIKYLASNDFDLSLILVGEPELKDNTRRIEVDPSVITNFLEKKHMTKTEFSRSIGRGRSHISNILCGDKTISRSDYLAIKSIYGIDVEKKPNNITDEINAIESIPTKPLATKLQVKDDRQVKDLTASELEKLIYRAVYSSIKHTEREVEV